MDPENGAFVEAHALGSMAKDPDLTVDRALEAARKVYTADDRIASNPPKVPLTESAAKILETYRDADGNLPRIGTFGEQNEFLTKNLIVPGTFGDAVLMRTAEPVPEEPGCVRVTLTGVPEIPRPGTGYVTESYVVNVCGKRRAPFLESRTTGALLRKLAYTNNGQPRTFSQLLECLGPKK